MDARRFNELARVLGGSGSRRRVIGAMAAIVGAGAGLVATGDGAAAPRRTCRPTAASCLRSSQCCSGTCAISRTTPRNMRNRCICIPQCDGKICGSDGCTGTCGDCQEGETCCGGDVCADLANDADNCGACGNACADGETCCDGVCADLANDTDNCGACGTVCAGGALCSKGVCGVAPDSCAGVDSDIWTCSLSLDGWQYYVCDNLPAYQPIECTTNQQCVDAYPDCADDDKLCLCVSHFRYYTQSYVSISTYTSGILTNACVVTGLPDANGTCDPYCAATGQSAAFPERCCSGAYSTGTTCQ